MKALLQALGCGLAFGALGTGCAVLIVASTNVSLVAASLIGWAGGTGGFVLGVVLGNRWTA